MKTYPRIELDITFKDLSSNLVSTFFSERTQIVRKIQSFWCVPKEVLVTLSVRTSFDLLLQSLNLPAGSEIIMSAVNISHMEEIVKKHNCIPRLVDIDLETLAPIVEQFKLSISEQSRIFVIAHLFGSVAALEPYVEICKSQNILLVEDCAQAFDGLQYLGHPEADVSFFSFGPIKSCTALGGSVTLVKKHLAKKMVSVEQTYPAKSEIWFLKRRLKYFCLKLLATPKIFGIFVACLNCLKIDLNYFVGSLARGFSKGDIQTQLRYRPPKGLLKLLEHRLKTLDSSRYTQREQMARNFLALLDNPDASPGRKTIRHSYWLVPLITEDPSALMQELRAEGFDTATGTTSLTALGQGSVYAKKLINYILYLPIYPSLPAAEVTHLAQLIRHFQTEGKCKYILLES